MERGQHWRSHGDVPIRYGGSPTRRRRRRVGTTSAALPSPFPPIAEYAFLSDCHTGALVAPDGAVDWLCVPRFDSPERLRQPARPRGRHVPLRSLRHQRPDARGATSPARTCWRRRGRRPSGWVVVRDALTMGPTRGPDTVTPHTRPPADDDAEHMLVRTAECLERPRRDGAGVRAGVRLRRHPGDVVASWTGRATSPMRPAATSRSGCTPTCRSASRAAGCGAATCSRAGERVYCALSWAEGLARPPTSTTPRRRVAATVAFWRRWLDRARIPDHRYREAIQRSALAIKGLTYMPTGRHRGRADDRPAGDARRRAQLGLPLQLDARLHVHAAGAALAEPRLGGRRVHAVRRRPRAQRRRRHADHVRHRRAPRPDRVDARPPERLRGARPVRDRQRRLRPAPERRVRRRARRHPPALPAQPAPAPPAVADRAGPGRVRHGRVAPTRPGHLGGAGQAPALRVVEADVLGRPRPGGQAGRAPRRRRARRHAGRRRPTRSTPTSSSTASATTACCASTTTPTPSTPRRCWRRSSASCPATTSGRTPASWPSPTT